ncbi:jg25661 [Pararge aegeria aegeria]|uniref:Jg25661 protein n=1 Tax=Pararge aegeria aegeria TaxID=348720 RepID=A0A8S4QH04_9NEOP|nr:jg25661 [Pararge aegeria aegeria]
MEKRKPQPLVLGSPAIPGSGSGYGNGGARGVKNLRKTDDIRRVAGSRWRQAAQDRALSNSLQKTYVQQWTSIG